VEKQLLRVLLAAVARLDFLSLRMVVETAV
jgi:hypothetical protein